MGASWGGKVTHALHGYDFEQNLLAGEYKKDMLQFINKYRQSGPLGYSPGMFPENTN
jgi:hypothetical protein